MKPLLKKELKSIFYSKRVVWLAIAFVVLLVVVVWLGYSFGFGRSNLVEEEVKNYPKDVAFIEGHEEIDQVYLLDAEKVLSEDYHVHRGEIGNRVGALDGFAAIIIAGPKEKYLEEEKYVLDQYIMQGGRVLWLMDGVYISEEDMKMQGWSASIKNDVNLDDMLATYGARVKSQFIQNRDCNNIQLISNTTGELVAVPNLYSPRVVIDHTASDLILADIRSLYLSFVSPVEFIESSNIKSTILLKTPDESNLVYVPEPIDLTGQYGDLEDKTRFRHRSIPFAISLEGEFTSHYLRSEKPIGISTENGTRNKGKSKMIVIGTSSIFRNELKGQGEDTEILPMGYDRTTELVSHSNAELLRNVMNWLTNDESKKQ